MNSGIQRSKLILLTVVHFLTDLFSSLLMPILPALVNRLNLSLTQAGILTGLPAMTSSLVQPIMGILGDRMEKRYFIIIGPLICAIFMSSVGLASSFPFLLLLIILGGFGSCLLYTSDAADE